MAISCRIVHFVHDRVRLRVDLIKSDARSAELLQPFLKDQPGIRTVRMNRACGSVIVTYDLSRWSPQALLDLIQGLSPEGLRAYGSNSPRRNGQRTELSVNPGSELALSSTAVLLGWLSESLAAPLLPWLLLGSAWSMFGRAYEALTDKGKLNVDVLDAAATSLLTL